MHSKKIAGFVIGSIGVGIAVGVALAVKSIIEDRVDLTVVTDKTDTHQNTDVTDGDDASWMNSEKSDRTVSEQLDKAMNTLKSRKYTDLIDDNVFEDFDEKSEMNDSVSKKKPSKKLTPYKASTSIFSRIKANKKSDVNNNINDTTDNDFLDDELPVNHMSSDFDDDEMDLSELNFDNSTDF